MVIAIVILLLYFVGGERKGKKAEDGQFFPIMIIVFSETYIKRSHKQNNRTTDETNLDKQFRHDRILGLFLATKSLIYNTKIRFQSDKSQISCSVALILITICTRTFPEDND